MYGTHFLSYCIRNGILGEKVIKKVHAFSSNYWKKVSCSGIVPALFFNQGRYRLLTLQTSLDSAVYLGMNQISEVEGILFTSSTNICPEQGGRAQPDFSLAWLEAA